MEDFYEDISLACTGQEIRREFKICPPPLPLEGEGEGEGDHRERLFFFSSSMGTKATVAIFWISVFPFFLINRESV